MVTQPPATSQPITATPPIPAVHVTVTSPIPDPLLRAVYASDQAMYPAALSYARLRAWVDACPDLALCFRDNAAAAEKGEEKEAGVAGVAIVLPLKRAYWEGLLCGRLKEAEIEPGLMFPCVAGEVQGRGCKAEIEEVGLHVYHIERFGTGSWGSTDGRVNQVKRFSEYALEEVARRVQARDGWKVIGMSALTATPAGKRAFARLGFIATGYRELFVEKEGPEGSASGEAKQQVEMICLYPDDEGRLDEADGGAVIASTSEMTVKYGGLLDFVDGARARCNTKCDSDS